MTIPPEPGGVVIGLIFAALGVYALYSGEAGMPSVLGMWTTRREENQNQYWLIVVLLFLFAAISFLRAFGLVVL